MQDKRWWDDPGQQDKAWQSMRNELDRVMPVKRKKRGLIWWFSGVAAVTLITLIILPFDHQNVSTLVAGDDELKEMNPHFTPGSSDTMTAIAHAQGPTSLETETTLASSGTDDLLTSETIIPVQSHHLSNESVLASGPNKDLHRSENATGPTGNTSPKSRSSADSPQNTESISSGVASAKDSGISNHASHAVLIHPIVIIPSSAYAVTGHRALVLPAVRVKTELSARKWSQEIIAGVHYDPVNQAGGWHTGWQLAWNFSGRFSLAAGLDFAKWYDQRIVEQYSQDVNASSPVDPNGRVLTSQSKTIHPAYLQFPVDLRYHFAKHWQLGAGISWQSLLNRASFGTLTEKIDATPATPDYTPDFNANPQFSANSSSISAGNWAMQITARYQYRRWFTEGFYQPGLTPFIREGSDSNTRQVMGVRVGIRF
ncbi:MAG: hypothetical protein KDC57_14855 [Saprospiraceae bacterium]|nr:hypothetical protein [Saprospiraceae bacterium]